MHDSEANPRNAE
ncbi:hypothetical protein D049_1509A, partial [Vibrio parahaemolyticus VPTS-2010]